MPLSRITLGDRRGAALLIVLWLAVGAAGLALALLETSRAAVPDGRRAVDAARLRGALEAAVHATADRLLAEAVELAPEGGRLELVLDAIEVRVRVVAESGLVDLGTASPGLLLALAEASGWAGPEARALVAEIERRRDGRGRADPAGASSATAVDEAGLRPPARPGLDHPIEVAALADSPAEVAEGDATGRWLSSLTLGTGRTEPHAELAPAQVRAALAGTSAPPGPSAGRKRGDEAPATAGAATEPEGRRADPAGLYRLEIVAATPGGRLAARSVRLALRPGETRPVRIVDWSAPQALPVAGRRAEGS